MKDGNFGNFVFVVYLNQYMCSQNTHICLLGSITELTIVMYAKVFPQSHKTTLYIDFYQISKISKISKKRNKIAEISKKFPKWKKNSNFLSFLSNIWISLGPKYVLDMGLKFTFP